jgi:hypothetical protein
MLLFRFLVYLSWIHPKSANNFFDCKVSPPRSGVHFKNAIESQKLTVVDGIWQISDTPTNVKADTLYDKMTIRTVDANAGTITMDNKDNAVTLPKNKDFVLMPGISIKTADSDSLRFYIYSEKNCRCRGF